MNVELEELELVEGTVLVTVLLEEEEVEGIEVDAIVVVELEELEEDVPLKGWQYGGVGSAQ